MNARQLSAILAGLRLLQSIESEKIGSHAAAGFSEILEIASDDGTHEPLTGDEIDALCEELNGEELDEDDAMTPRPECGHSACIQNWIETGESVCVERENALEELLSAGRALKMDRAGIADANAMFVAPVVAKADAEAFVAALAAFEELE
ncbi:MAG: RING finger protein [Elusimicrobiales bacterium]